MYHEKIQKQIKVVERKVFAKMFLMKQPIYTNVNIFYILVYSRERCNIKTDLQVQKQREKVSTPSIKILVHKSEGK